MTNATSSVSLSLSEFPAGTTVGGILFTLMSGTGQAVQTQTAAAGQTDTQATVTFPSVPVGTGYKISAARVDSNGNVISTAIVSAPFDIIAMTPVLVTVPSGTIGVSLQTAQMTVDFGAGFATGTGALQLLNAATVVGSKLSISPAGAAHVVGGFWHKTQQDITQFETSFTFQIPSPPAGTEIAGFAFVIQNSNSTTNPLAFGVKASADANAFNYGAYESLGGNQQSIMNSVAVYFDLGCSGQNCYPISSGGSYSTVGLAVNGGSDNFQGFVPTNDLNPSGVNLHSGNVFSCRLSYDGTTLTMVLKDTVTASQYRASWPINIPACVGGSMAWVGIGGANVIATVGQEIDILTWQFLQGVSPILPSPVFSPAAGNYSGAQSVTLSGPPGASIYYTVNGLPPTSSSTLYTVPITVATTEYLQAVSIKPGCRDSAVSVASYQIGAPALVNLGSGFSSGDGMILCGNALRSGSKIQLTDTLHLQETGTAWWGVPVKVSGTFSTAFTLQFTAANANGMCFVLQNKNKHASDGYMQKFGTGQLHVTGGPTAMGNFQSGLGYGTDRVGLGFVGLYSSVALAFNLFGTTANSVGLYSGGVNPNTAQTPIAGISLASGHPITVSVAYDGTTLSMTMTDTVTSTTFTHSWTIDIPGQVGDSSAYAGFTAATAGGTANMLVNSWTFV